jgi:hypothetical protein
MLGNRLTGKKFVPKTKELRGEWRKLHNEELRDLYWSLDIVRAIRLRSMGFGRARGTYGCEE